MKISLDWLKQFVDYRGSSQQLAELLWSLGLESAAIDNDLVDVEITANRGDCLSVLGIAREVAAKVNLPLRQPSSSSLSSLPSLRKEIQVSFANPEICPRYSYYIIDNIKIAKSPEWLKKRLASADFRPLNNIVDITNFVMLELGQPLHAFDYDKIKAAKMNIRLAKNGEEIITLDGQNQKLPEKTIVIEDDEKIFDLAGIMGGYNSEVDEKTKTIVLQAAIFDPVLIRQASRALNKTTDASYRYERSVDFENTINALNRAAKLILETSPNAKVSELFDLQNQKYLATIIDFSVDKINQLLGMKYSEKEIVDSLTRLGFETCPERSRGVTVPSWRAFDIKIWQDLAEEIARLSGYDKIPLSEIRNSNVECRNNKDFDFKNNVREYLIAEGFDEVANYSFDEEKEIETLGIKEKLPEIIKPVNPKIKNYRGSLIPGLIKTIAKNPWLNQISVFEINDIWRDDKEQTFVGIATTDKLGKIMGIPVVTIDANHPLAKIHKLKRTISVGEMPITTIVIPHLMRNLDSRFRSSSLSDERQTSESNDGNDKEKQNKIYKEISKFPPTIRDLAIVVDKNINADEIIETIKKESEQILICELFDEYENNKFGANKKSLAFHIIYQDLKKTMTDEEAEKIHQKVIGLVKNKFNAVLR